MNIEYTSLGLLAILQYTIVIFILLKKPEWVNGEGALGIFPWIPVLGPIAIITGGGFILVVVTPFLLPLAIANTIIYVLNKFVDTKIDYLK